MISIEGVEKFYGFIWWGYSFKYCTLDCKNIYILFLVIRENKEILMYLHCSLVVLSAKK